MNENDLTYQIRSSIFEVYKLLGPGLLESVYEAALCFELSSRGYKVQSQKPIPVIYKGHRLDMGFRIDVLVEDKVLVEVKATDQIANVHHKQTLTYLRLTGLKVGLLVNFNTSDVNQSIYRKVNNL